MPFRKDDKLHTMDQTPAALIADGLNFISSFQVLLWSDTPKILRTRRELCVYLRKRKRQALGKTIINVILTIASEVRGQSSGEGRGLAGYSPRTRGTE